MLTGGRDGKAQIMNRSLNTLITINLLNPEFESVSGEVRSLTFSFVHSKLLIGTFGGEIYEAEINIASKSITKITSLMRSHYSPSRKVYSVIVIIER